MNTSISCLFVLLFQFLAVNCKENHGKVLTKRLLLTDPDVIGSRLSHIEAELQQQLSKITALETENMHLKKELADQKLKYENNIHQQGSTYIRWGRDDCSGANTDIVYSGYASGEKYFYSSSYKGGASTMLCLPNNPELSNMTGGGNSQLYGTEYEDSKFGPGRLNEDVTCALCRSKNTSSSVMFPARKTCYPGWKEEYRGIIASSSYSHNPAPYICVDENPNFITGGERTNDEHLLYTTQTKCGSLPCPPYSNNRQVLCVVCSK